MGQIYHNQVKDKVTLTEMLEAAPKVYYDSSYASLAEAVATIGSALAELVITTANFPDGDKVTVPATLTLTFEGEGSLSIA
jgi:hypothetical protein